MLVIHRQPGQAVVIDGRITVRVLRVSQGRVELGFDAPRDVPIERTERLSAPQEPAHARR